ncbi:hypothetical protein LEP1GSC132_3090 [Leptospira kirschneri str. 200803703]|nr:hypothetical protein LEP1GSC064_2254 [Leptospira kirschneri serovar Grippotyphosa str. Moskva]EKR07258.1 hypothetical protein LEP1GSC122_2881 [Leptospira kirschneri serovar Valbuzzi str. 200702274]EMK15642.1 hypothetical protein LEP1GSC042_0120 [Leptospira kirschneri serovar Bim str. PUO 1247]EMN05169.1 hypothetical protein LEP1GSC046_3534 [Leptospira kirschneri serovar Bim str. 1051]EMN24134.1 hypothetical protein LEP1GSC065_1539 [Leptospira kirschneri serovar Sokoine str. RM1]EMO67331.1 h
MNLLLRGRVKIVPEISRLFYKNRSAQKLLLIWNCWSFLKKFVYSNF